jgi:hypothetical protein
MLLFSGRTGTHYTLKDTIKSKQRAILFGTEIILHFDLKNESKFS